MQKVKVERKGDLLLIGEEPQLVIDLVNQKNYILTQGKKILYMREVCFSPDLLAGKRQNVFETAVRYFYNHACQVACGTQLAEAYRAQANTTIREVK